MIKQITAVLCISAGLLFAGTYSQDLAELEKACKSGDKYDCYSVKRYKIFHKACKEGDKHSCTVLADLREFKAMMDNGDVSMGQSFDWSINNEKTTKEMRK